LGEVSRSLHWLWGDGAGYAVRTKTYATMNILVETPNGSIWSSCHLGIYI
jgi:hypothetical protein